MKKTLITLSILVGLASCKEQAGNVVRKPFKLDSAVTTIRYVLGSTGKVDERMVLRYVRDTVVSKSDTSENGQKVTTTLVPSKDTVYKVPFQDTLKVNGVVQLDSLKKPVLETKFFALPARWVLIDYNKSF